MQFSLDEIAALVNGEVCGDGSLKVRTISPIDNIVSDSIVFAEGVDNINLVEQSIACAMLVDQSIQKSNKPFIRVANPFHAFICLLNHFYPKPMQFKGVHPTAIIGEDVCLGENVSIGPYVVIESGSSIGNNCIIKSHVSIGHNVVLGSDCVIHPNVVLYDASQLGNNVIIHSSSVIGSDGFGYRLENGKQIKVPHVGNVVIANDVEIGANTVIDKATLGSTVIGEGTKIDNLVQVAHSVKLGKNNILCAFTGIAGSTSSGNNVVFAANVGVSDHVRIDDGVILGARAGVPPKKHLKHGNIYLGNPARPKDKAIEHELSATRIPLMRKNLQALTLKVADLSQKIKILTAEE